MSDDVIRCAVCKKGPVPMGHASLRKLCMCWNCYAKPEVREKRRRETTEATGASAPKPKPARARVRKPVPKKKPVHSKVNLPEAIANAIDPIRARLHEDVNEDLADALEKVAGNFRKK